jgi:hypothetical protein
MGQNFSIEINSKKNINKIILNDDKGDFLIEGTLGDFLSYTILEDKLLEVKCTDGILRLELNESMLTPFLPYPSV